MKLCIGLLAALLLCAHGSTLAMPPPTVVIDDKLALGVPITAVTLDSTHFAERTLLVGTDTSLDGRSFVIRVSGLPLSVVDTLVQLATPISIVRAGFLDADRIPDLLIGLDTTVVRMRTGPLARTDTIPIVVEYATPTYQDPNGTIVVPGIIKDIEIDDSSCAFWVGYQAIATFYPWWNEYQRRSVGGLRRFDSLGFTVTEVSGSLSALDIRWWPVPEGTQRGMMAFWHFGHYINVQTAPDYDRELAGYAMFADTGGTIYNKTLLTLSSSDFWADISFLTPVPVADMTGDGVAECVLSYWLDWCCPMENTRATATYTLGEDSALWSVEGQWPTSAWELDGDGLPDVMLHSGRKTRAFKGSTGDSLFTLETDYSIVPKATGTLDETGRQKAVITRADTIIVYHLKGDGYDLSAMPLSFTLHPTYPNPFNQGTTIHFSTSEVGGPAVMRLSIHNILGRRVRSFGEQSYSQGDYQINWDGRNDQGKPVPTGVYFVMLRSGDDVQATKMMLLK